jgi:hypothetical protein
LICIVVVEVCLVCSLVDSLLNCCGLSIGMGFVTNLDMYLAQGKKKGLDMQ